MTHPYVAVLSEIAPDHAPLATKGLTRLGWITPLASCPDCDEGRPIDGRAPRCSSCEQIVPDAAETAGLLSRHPHHTTRSDGGQGLGGRVRHESPTGGSCPPTQAAAGRTPRGAP